MAFRPSTYRSRFSGAGFIWCLAVLITSCDFNKVFLAPSPIPASAKKGTVVNTESGDTTVIHIGTNFQPRFTDTRDSLLKLDYTVESILVKNEAGNTLNCWIIRPLAGGDVVLFFLHGNGGNIISHYRGVLPLVKKGFIVFMTDYSGFGFSQGKATRVNILGDALSTLDYLKTRGDLNRLPLIVYGQSLGGHLAVSVAAQAENKINALVVEGAFSSHKDIAAKRAGFFGRWLVRERYSAVRSVERFHKPLLVVHSTEDEVIPFRMGKKIFDHANEPKQFYEIKRGHISGPLYFSDSLSVKMRRMLKD